MSGQSRVRTYVLVREQIYSLSPLTTRPSAPEGLEFGVETTLTSNSKHQTYRAEDGTRTRDLLITNQLLYQLSYFGIKFEILEWNDFGIDDCSIYRFTF